mmetsp:Transcript_15816/g.18808  ORF Transcript_15816/g.18808 Transcript_15816/m.18808 type:complete len:152 (-) Transcript_15816:260-715(-)
MEVFGTSWTYTLQSNLQPVVAVYVWAFLDILNIFLAFVYWYWYNNSLLDFISLAGNAALLGQNLFFLVPLTFSLDSEGKRKNYFYSSLFASFAPIFLWPILLVAYVVHAYLNKSKYSSTSYMVVKYLLFFIWDLLVAFWAFETIFPMYSWW